jgi:drug/metabolite transporter (DMT)-like permease
VPSERAVDSRAMGAKMTFGTLGAVAGAIAGALLWAAITAATSFQIGFMAVGVGFLAGSAMRFFSGGRERIEGIVAGIVAFFGCVLGNLLATVMTFAQHEHMSPATTAVVALGVLANPSLAYRLSAETFNVMDVVFYAIAIYAGYRTALKPRLNQEPDATATVTTAP